MPSLTPQLRKMRAQTAAHASWAQTEDRSARTAPARAAALSRFEHEVDPERKLPATERARRAAHARKAYFARLAYQSALARHRKAQAAAASGKADARRSS